MPLTVLINPYLWTHESRGFRVHAIKDLSVVNATPGREPIVLSIDSRGRMFLNSREVSTRELRSEVEEAMKLRADKVIFFYADGETDYGQVMNVIDTISVAHVQIVLVSSRDE